MLMSVVFANAQRNTNRESALIFRHYVHNFGKLDYLEKVEHNFKFKEVQEHPVLYQDCYVIWKGRVSNLVIGENSINFDLLVGYETEQVLEGIVPVQLNFAAHIDPAFPIEVLGRIEPEGNQIYLEAKSIHQFIPEEG